MEACHPRGKTPPRHLRRTIEAMIWRHLRGRPTEWRAIATRSEKTATSFVGVLCLAAALDWVKLGRTRPACGPGPR